MQVILDMQNMLIVALGITPRSAGGRGASVSTCADLTNQLQCCWVDPACAWKKH